MAKPTRSLPSTQQPLRPDIRSFCPDLRARMRLQSLWNRFVPESFRFQPEMGRKFVTLTVGTPQCPYGIAYLGGYGLSHLGRACIVRPDLVFLSDLVPHLVPLSFSRTGATRQSLPKNKGRLQRNSTPDCSRNCSEMGCGGAGDVPGVLGQDARLAPDG